MNDHLPRLCSPPDVCLLDNGEVRFVDPPPDRVIMSAPLRCLVSPGVAKAAGPTAASIGNVSRVVHRTGGGEVRQMMAAVFET